MILMDTVAKAIRDVKKICMVLTSLMLFLQLLASPDAGKLMTIILSLHM